jgi:tetraacyldisaccharide 4'-kinase
MRAPEFWAEDGLPAQLLEPFGHLFGLAGRLRRRLVRARRAPVPVICIGNLTVGGAGKTPTVLALAERLLARGVQPHILTRGYGGRERGPLRVEPENHDHTLVGDEALLLAAVAPTWVARDRLAGARAAARTGAECLLMDDGFQDPHLAPDQAFVVVDGGYGFGNRRLLPAGPLRERLADGLARASAVIRIGPDRHDIDRLLPPALPRIDAELRPAPDAPALAGRRVLAFAGMGRPDKLFATLSAAGAELIGCERFADHHRYRRAEIERLLARAARAEALCITTTKDAVRLPPDLRSGVAVLPVVLCWQEPEILDRLLERAVGGSTPDRDEAFANLPAPKLFLTCVFTPAAGTLGPENSFSFTSVHQVGWRKRRPALPIGTLASAGLD